MRRVATTIPPIMAKAIGPQNTSRAIGIMPRLAAAAAELRKKGVQVEEENPKFFGAYGDSPSFYVRDPDGYKVELKAR